MLKAFATVDYFPLAIMTLNNNDYNRATCVGPAGNANEGKTTYSCAMWRSTYRSDGIMGAYSYFTGYAKF